MNELVWTRAKPTTPGFYFWRASPNETPVCSLVYLDPVTSVLKVENPLGADMQISKTRREWSGPIPLPREAEA
jgi:hypothetical protein